MSSSITPLTVGGISQYASDFQSILDRAVQFASLPVQQLQNEQANIQTEAQQAATLGSAAAGVSSALTSLGALGTGKALVANTTDSSVVSAQVTGATTGTSYSITNVTSIASAAAESSVSSYNDATTVPVSTTGSMQLVVGSKTYQINLSGSTNTLGGLRDAINSQNAGVNAQIFTTAGGDYLSVSANTPGATTLQLIDDPTGAATQVLTNLHQGTNTVFQLNGVNVSTPSTNINNVVPGVTFTINGTTTANEAVTVSLTSDRSQISSALQSLVSSYNSLAQQVNNQSGPGAGALAGNSVVWQVRNSMLQLTGFNSPGGSIHSLADLGFSVDQTGTASFDATQLNALSDSQLADAFTFLGSDTTGLGKVADSFTQISDPVNGIVAAQLAGFTVENQRLTTSIAADTDRINTMQSLLKLQLSQADAQVATLQSQQNLLTSSIQSLQYSTYGQQILSSQGV